MSDYRPWELNKPTPPAEPEAPGDPAARSPAPEPEPAVDVERTRVVSAPGTEVPDQPRGDRGRVLAATALLWGAGFLFFGAIVLALALNLVIGIEQVDGDATDIGDARSVRAIAVPLMLLASTPAMVAGFGLLYQQAWARPLGQVVAGLQMLTLIGILPGALALGGLAAWRPR